MPLPLAVERRRNLLKRELRRDLFYLFSSWSGIYGTPFDKSSPGVGGGLAPNAAISAAANVAVSFSAAAASTSGSGGTGEAEPPTATSEFEFSALQVSEGLFFTLHFKINFQHVVY